MLTVAVLGPLEVRRGDEAVAVPAGRCTELLLRLALDAGRAVPADRLVEDLWADEAATTTRNTLQSKVSQLRRALGDPGALPGTAAGYALAVDREAVDALRLGGLAERSATARTAGDPAHALATAEAGLALFRGPVLPEAGDAAWAQPHRVRLEELRLGLVEDELVARVALGDGAPAIARLEALVEEHPLREGLWAALVTALYRAGRQGDALAAHARVRRLLGDELGVDPGPALRDLEARVLRQDAALLAPPSSSVVRAGTPPRRGNLPALASPLVGRAADVAALTRLLTQERLVTVVGTAGVGKSRLALEVARGLDAPGGVWLVRLDAAGPGTSLRRLVAEALDLPGGEPVLLDRLAAAPTVLVLDTCEHVVPSVAALVPALLDAADGLRVLATSQVPLGLDGERLHALDPLGPEDAVALFADRAAALGRGFTLDAATAAVVEDVCRALDGVPLAIELAAARVRALSVQEIARRLDDRFALLRDPSGRRRALSTAIGWSYDLLFPDDQRGLWALAGFTGGAPLPAVEHVLAALDVPGAAAADVADRLAERSLVGVDVGPDGAVRYRLLDSIRAWARDRAREAGVADVVADAHARWFADRAAECARDVRGPGQAGCLAFARSERGNVDAALARAADADPLLGLRLALDLGWTWVVLGDGVAGAARVRSALTAAGALAPAQDAARAGLLAGWLEASAGDLDRAEADLAAVPGTDDADRRDLLRHRAFLRIQQGRPADVVADADAAARLADGLGTAWEAAGARLLRAYGELMLGRTRDAAATASAARRVLLDLDDAWGLVHADGILATVARADGDLGAAGTALARAAGASERLGFLGQAALHLTRLGEVEHLAGRPADAVATLGRALDAAAASGDLRMAAAARVHLARALEALGDRPAALALLEAADAWFAAAGGGEEAGAAADLLAALRARP